MAQDNIHSIHPADIVQGIEPNELVEIESVRTMGNRILISGIVCSTKRRIQKPFTQIELEKLQIVRSGAGYSFDGDAEKFLLGVEAERISIAYQFDPLFAVNSSVIDELPHQVEAVYKYLLPLPRIRFLLADDTGAGKTIMAGLLLKELFFRGTIQRALIITPGGLTKQWQEDELQEKFGLQFKLIDRAVFKSNPNEFAVADRCVASLDFIRQDDVIAALEPLQWDIIIVDEAHKLSAYEYRTKIDKRERYKALEKLSKRTDHLLFLTATPHRGRKDTFRRLMMLLDEDIFTKDEHVERRVLQGNEAFEYEGKIKQANNRFFLRRLKEDMVNWDSTPLYVPREATTPGYDLTPEELRLYHAVTNYVQRLRKTAKEQRNKNVELMLMVMQRRLTSSMYAITQTLKNRASRLREVLELIRAARAHQKQFSFDTLTDGDIPDSYEEYEELTEEQRQRIDERINRFVLSQNPEDVQKELGEVVTLVELAESLKGHEEQKFTELRKVLDETDMLRNEDGRLVIFTEHRDTLTNLKERLEQKGFQVSVIHGQMNVDERKKAQREFRLKSKIMLATDAAGEGINLQFCNYLINWDIPWNPNRLEQRMGRIHRYGQRNKVRVFNLVAQNTREGMVLKRILDKLEIMREQMGTDRVYDVISELLEDVPLSECIQSDSHDKTNETIAIIDNLDSGKTNELIGLQQRQSLISKLDLTFTQSLRRRSEERRLQPYFIERFFIKAFRAAGGSIRRDESYPVFTLGRIPDELLAFARERKLPVAEQYANAFVFDKNLVSIASKVKLPEGTKLLGPGHPLFEILIEHYTKQSRETFARGAKLIDPRITQPQTAWLLRSTVKDSRTDERTRIAHQRLDVVIEDSLGLRSTSASYFIDCCPDSESSTLPVQPHTLEDVSIWAYEHITIEQLKKAETARHQECAIREEYLRTAFTDLIMDRQSEINELDHEALLGANVMKEREQLQSHIDHLKKRRESRLAEVQEMLSVDAELPEVLTSAVINPLPDDVSVEVVSSEPEEETRTAMHRDDEVEAIAMRIATEYERTLAQRVQDVSAENGGYDILSERNDGSVRYIEVKGRALSGAVILTENELQRLRQLETRSWLYVVTHCASGEPKLTCINNPASVLKTEEIFRQVQYLVPEREWKNAGERIS